MDGRRVRGWSARAALVVAVATTSPALAQVYQCQVRQGLTLSEGGVLQETEVSRMQAALFDGRLTFDLTSSRLIWGTISWEMRVVQRGSKNNSLAAVRVYAGPVAVVLQTLQIQTWTKGMPFVFQNQDDVLTGTCTN